MKWLTALLILSNFAYGACKEVTVKGEVLCHEAKEKRFLSKSCKSVLSCFPYQGELKLVPNQSPGFTLCYSLKGEPFFEKVNGEKTSTSFCRRDGKTVDINSLLHFHGPRRKLTN
jgi:hypothetical protein